MKTYNVTLIHKIWFYGVKWLIIPKSSLLPLLIWSTYRISDGEDVEEHLLNLCCKEQESKTDLHEIQVSKYIQVFTFGCP